MPFAHGCHLVEGALPRLRRGAGMSRCVTLCLSAPFTTIGVTLIREKVGTPYSLDFSLIWEVKDEERLLEGHRRFVLVAKKR